MSNPEQGSPKAVIFGCAGPALTADERALFRASRPLGFILFARNCVDPDQLRRLVAELRVAIASPDAPVLIDQEGGRVARLGPPHWRKPPPARVFGALAERDRAAGREATMLNARLIGRELAGLGITVDCTPVLDVPAADGHDIIGDRAFAVDPTLVAGTRVSTGTATSVRPERKNSSRASPRQRGDAPGPSDTMWEAALLGSPIRHTSR